MTVAMVVLVLLVALAFGGLFRFGRWLDRLERQARGRQMRAEDDQRRAAALLRRQQIAVEMVQRRNQRDQHFPDDDRPRGSRA